MGNQCLSSWAGKTPSNVDTRQMLRDTSCSTKVGSPNPSVGPWCQGVKDGCTVSPTAPQNACMDSTEFNCAKFLKSPKKRGKKCGKIKNGEKVRNLCPKTCKRFLCNCVDEVNKFVIKGKKGKKFTCAELNTKYCKKKNKNGFTVQSICPNKCDNRKNCL